MAHFVPPGRGGANVGSRGQAGVAARRRCRSDSTDPDNVLTAAGVPSRIRRRRRRQHQSILHDDRGRPARPSPAALSDLPQLRRSSVKRRRTSPPSTLDSRRRFFHPPVRPLHSTAPPPLPSRLSLSLSRSSVGPLVRRPTSRRRRILHCPSRRHSAHTYSATERRRKQPTIGNELVHFARHSRTRLEVRSSKIFRHYTKSKAINPDTQYCGTVITTHCAYVVCYFRDVYPFIYFTIAMYVHHLGLYCILFRRFLISKINVALQLTKL